MSRRHQTPAKPKSRAIVPKEVPPYRPPRVIPDPTPKKTLAEFGPVRGFVLTPVVKDAPKLSGYTCSGAWSIYTSEDDRDRFNTLSHALGNVVTLFHGSPAKNIVAIAEDGLKPGRNTCMFGSGIYAGPIEKALNYTGYGGAKYVIRVRVILGKVRECPAAEKWSLSKLQAAGFDSVGATAGWTASWGGTLRHSENVVYSPDQILAEKVFEYQQNKFYTPEVPMSGPCGLAGVRKAPLPPGSRAFHDVLSRVICGTTAANKLRTDLGVVWACSECIQRLRIKVGSKIEVKTKREWIETKVRGSS